MGVERILRLWPNTCRLYWHTVTCAMLYIRHGLPPTLCLHRNGVHPADDPGHGSKARILKTPHGDTVASIRPKLGVSVFCQNATSAGFRRQPWNEWSDFVPQNAFWTSTITTDIFVFRGPQKGFWFLVEQRSLDIHVTTAGVFVSCGRRIGNISKNSLKKSGRDIVSEVESEIKNFKN